MLHTCTCTCTFLKYRDHYTSNIIVAVPMQHILHVHVFTHTCYMMKTTIFEKDKAKQHKPNPKAVLIETLLPWVGFEPATFSVLGHH